MVGADTIPIDNHQALQFKLITEKNLNLETDIESIQITSIKHSLEFMEHRAKQLARPTLVPRGAWDGKTTL
jgi:hypothetical protein